MNFFQIMIINMNVISILINDKPYTKNQNYWFIWKKMFKKGLALALIREKRKLEFSWDNFSIKISLKINICPSSLKHGKMSPRWSMCIKI